MCYITRRIFPCCSRENWYADPIPQQCTGVPRCDSGDCIVLGARATVLDRGRCWRCILEDMKRGVRTGVSDKALREAQKIGEENGWGVGKRKKEKKNKKGRKDGSKKRKRSRMEEQEEAEEEPMAKKMRGWNAFGESSNTNVGMPPSIMPYTQPETLKNPSGLHPWSNPGYSDSGQPSRAITPPREEFGSFLNASQPYSQPSKLPQNLQADSQQQNSGFDPNHASDFTIDPSLLWDWGDSDTIDRLLAQESNTGSLPYAGDNDGLSKGKEVAMEEQPNSSKDLDQTANLFGHVAALNNFEQNAAFDEQAFSRFLSGDNLNQWAGFDDMNAAWLTTPGAVEQNTAPTPEASSALTNAANLKQNPAVGKMPASSPVNHNAWDNFVFPDQWPDLTTSQGAPNQNTQHTSNCLNADGNSDQGPRMPRNERVDPASIPLGDPMLFQSDFDFDEIIQWPPIEPRVGSAGDEVAGLDDQSRMELDNILFGAT